MILTHSVKVCLATRPWESQDVAAANPEIVARLQQELRTRDAAIRAGKRPAGKQASAPD